MSANSDAICSGYQKHPEPSADLVSDFSRQNLIPRNDGTILFILFLLNGVSLETPLGIPNV